MSAQKQLRRDHSQSGAPGLESDQQAAEGPPHVRTHAAPSGAPRVTSFTLHSTGDQLRFTGNSLPPHMERGVLNYSCRRFQTESLTSLANPSALRIIRVNKMELGFKMCFRSPRSSAAPTSFRHPGCLSSHRALAIHTASRPASAFVGDHSAHLLGHSGIHCASPYLSPGPDSPGRME